MVQIQIKVKGIDTMIKSFQEAPKVSARVYSQAIQSSGKFIQQRAMSYAPVNKRGSGGTLRQSIKARSLGQFSFGVLADTVYAAAVDQGSKPHVITPRNKPFLAFQIDGRWIRTKRVNHPGTKPTYFFTNAAKDGEGYLNRAMESAAQAVMDSIKSK